MICDFDMIEAHRHVDEGNNETKLIEGAAVSDISCDGEATTSFIK
jgi:hypothetical protein